MKGNRSVFHAFLANITMKSIKQSVNFATSTSTLTSQRKHHAIVAVSAKSLMQAVLDAPSVTVEKLVLERTALVSHVKQDSTEARPWMQHLAPSAQLATPLLLGVRNVSRTHQVGLPANVTWTAASARRQKHAHQARKVTRQEQHAICAHQDRPAF
jgi:hypothetical protein